MQEAEKRAPGRPRKYPAPVEVEKPVEFITEPVKVDVRRMTQSDIDKHSPWLVPMIQEFFGGPSVSVVAGWLRMWLLSNEYNIACTDNAVGLAMLQYDPLDPVPMVQEIFTFSQDGFVKDDISIYRHFIQWGKSVRASEFRFGKPAGDRKELLKAELPGFRWRSICYMEL